MNRPESYSHEEHPLHITRRGRRIVGGTVLAVTLLGAYQALEALDHEPERTIDTSITGVTITDTARLRSEPEAEGNNEAPNIIAVHEGDPVSISVEGALQQEDTVNGEWIGLTGEQLADNIPELGDVSDSDTVYWINAQRLIIERQQ